MTTTGASPGTTTTDEPTQFAIYRHIVHMRGLEKRGHVLFLQNLVSLPSRDRVKHVRADRAFRLRFAVRTLAEQSDFPSLLRFPGRRACRDD